MTPDMLREHPEIALAPGAVLHDAMAAMTQAQVSIALVVDDGGRLLGVLTDIDIRKALLSGSDMLTPVVKIMNPHPATASDQMTEEEIGNTFRAKSHAYIPVVDKERRLKRLAALRNYAFVPQRFPNRIVVMAGGCGKRLLPLTENTPKPMLRLGSKPILELLFEQFIAAGFGHFIFTVNYLADQIRDHFGDGSRWGVEIDYVQESQPMGTVGALSLIAPQHLNAPLLVINGDILTKVNFAALLDFHKTEGALATLCVKRHEMQVPYGVVEIADRRLRDFIEKPVHRWLVNAGIYVIEPETLAWIPKGRTFDMPEFIKEIRHRRANGIACFPIQEYWLDIGGLEEYRRAHDEFESHFDDR